MPKKKAIEYDGEELTWILGETEKFNEPPPEGMHRVVKELPRGFHPQVGQQCDIIEIKTSQLEMPETFVANMDNLFSLNPMAREDYLMMQEEAERQIQLMRQQAERMIPTDKPPRWMMVRSAPDTKSGKLAEGFGGSLLHLFDLNNFVPLTIRVIWDESDRVPVIRESEIDISKSLKTLLSGR